MNRTLCLLTLAGILGLASCAKNESTPQQGEPKLQLVLKDAPADYQAVYVSIKEVRINVGTAEADGVTEGSSGGTWVDYPLNANLAEPVNLLDLTNGEYVYMGEPMALPAGKISQIRLILNASGNTVVTKDGVSHTLTTPSAQQSGLKINLNQTLSGDHIYKIWLDFDADKSVVARGNGAYNLKPVIKAELETADFGAISGVVLPLEANTSVYLIKTGTTDTVGRTIPEVAGSLLGAGFYKFTMLSPGSYDVALNASDATSYKDVVIPGVVVSSGQIRKVTTTTLIQ